MKMNSTDKKWIFEFCTKFGFRNHLQTFWPRRLVKSELSLGLLIYVRHAFVFMVPTCSWGEYIRDQAVATSAPLANI